MSRARRFFSGWQNLLAIAIISMYVAVAITAPWLAPQTDPENPVMFRLLPGFRATSLRVPRPPQPDAILGTAPGGADVFYVLIWGTRPALYFGLVTALSTAFFGVLVGAIGGYVEGPLYRLILRITDAFLTVPAIAGIYLFSLVLAPRGTGCVTDVASKYYTDVATESGYVGIDCLFVDALCTADQRQHCHAQADGVRDGSQDPGCTAAAHHFQALVAQCYRTRHRAGHTRRWRDGAPGSCVYIHRHRCRVTLGCAPGGCQGLGHWSGW